MITKSQRRLAAFASALAFIAGLSLTGCQQAPTTNTATVNTGSANANTSATPAATRVSNAAGNGQPVTLAVLDALFADESFARDAKSKLGLTDEQIAELRRIGQEERASLRETEAGDHGGTTSAATQRAEAKIKAAIGDDKAGQLFALASQRWSGADAGDNGAGGPAATATGDRPNAVPTDTRIVVNAPGYRMDIFESGRLVKSYKVGIGYPEFPLPSGMRKADTIIFNPEWTPPDEPWVEAPGSKVKVGEKVAAGSKLNPLGPVKIPIGLPSLIHGGKSPARLGSFASHGCVGLTNDLALEVAREIARLGGADVSEEDIKTFQQEKTKTKNVKLAHAVPVELRYETVVVTDDGKLHIYRDVYDRATNTEENVRAVLQAHGVSYDQLDPQLRAQIADALQQMARDATGKPAEGDGTERPDGNANANKNADAGKNANSNKNANADKGGNKNANADKPNADGNKVTRTVKGQKEIVIDIPALRGKGYPAPVGNAFAEQPKGKDAAAEPKKGKRR